MSGNYTLALSREQYDAEEKRYLGMKKPLGMRDECVNLCFVGYTELDECKILLAFEFEKITDDFIEKIERVLIFLGTVEYETVKSIKQWMEKNKGNEYVLIYE